jgi:hypothetical protein
LHGDINGLILVTSSERHILHTSYPLWDLGDSLGYIRAGFFYFDSLKFNGSEPLGGLTSLVFYLLRVGEF